MSNSRSSERIEIQAPPGWYYFSEGKAWRWGESCWMPLGPVNRVVGSDRPLLADNGVSKVGYWNGTEWTTSAPMMKPTSTGRIVLRGVVVTVGVTIGLVILIWIMSHLTWLTCSGGNCSETGFTWLLVLQLFVFVGIPTGAAYSVASVIHRVISPRRTTAKLSQEASKGSSRRPRHV